MNSINSKTVFCPYCGEKAEWVDNKEIYGKRYGNSFMMYWCRKDDASVGTHNNTKKPLGTMANKELREWRVKAHAHIDPVWKEGKRSRGDVYSILKYKLGKQIHIGESDIETCKRILEVQL